MLHIIYSLLAHGLCNNLKLVVFFLLGDPSASEFYVPTLRNTLSYYNNIYLLQLGCYKVAVVVLHVNKTRNWLILNFSREGYMRSM